jgi:transporter family-2 protein
MELSRSLPYTLFVAIAVVAGFALPVQAGINGQLRMYLGHPLRASLGNFVVGAALLFVLTFFVREPWPALGALLRGPWWMWLGGVLGSLYICSALIVLPRLGASVTFALVVAGQMLASLAIDRFGLFGLASTPIGPARIAGAVLVVVAVYLLQR